MPPKMKFSDGEKVLCFHGPLIYEAKCLKSTVTKDKQVKYFVHYAGWSKNWDEWVPESRVLKFNEANVAKQKEVLKNHNTTPKSKKGKAKTAVKTDLNTSKDSDSRASTPQPDSEPKKATKQKLSNSASNSTSDLTQVIEPSKKKRGRPDSIAEPEEEYVAKVEIKIRIPDELKQILVDDWDIVTRQKKLWPVPVETTVDDILDAFVEYKKSTNKPTISHDSEVAEMANGIRDYFNTVLSTQLLYKFERPQYMEAMRNADQEGNLASAVYGGVHLLRLFVRLGNNLSFTPLDDRNVHFLVEHIHEFLKYLLINSGSLFNLQDSYVPSQDYLKKLQ